MAAYILTHGVPSADCLRRVFAALDPKRFCQGLEAWAQSVVGQLEGLHLAVDGKTVRGSAQRGIPAVHIVRAFVVQNHVVLGQLATDAQSNEITALPELLRTLALQGALVSIDAMGAQRAITQQIVDQGGAYRVTVKDHQPTLRAELEDALGGRHGPERSSGSFYQTEKEAHGRSNVDASGPKPGWRSWRPVRNGLTRRRSCAWSRREAPRPRRRSKTGTISARTS